MEIISQTINDLFDAYKPAGSNGHVKKIDVYEQIARRLNEITGENWGYRYVSTVAAGTTKPSRKFQQAVMALAAMIDGMPAHIAASQPAQVYVAPGIELRQGSLVQISSQPCAYPGCPTWIVSRSRYCCAEHKRLARNARQRQRREERKHG